MKATPFLVLLLSMLTTQAQKKRDKQIEEILEKLTLEEKAGQLNLIPIDNGIATEKQIEMIRAGKVGSVLKANGVDKIRTLQNIAINESRAGIPILFQEDVIHGYRTIAPIPLAEAASWDMQAIRKSAAVAAREAAASGINLTYAPMVDVARDPRWGRILETSGEDPYLGAIVAAARVKGFQESNESELNILSCVKHFAGYGAALAGRDYNIEDFSERTLRETYLPPFQAAIDAGVASLMCAYTAYDGVPLSVNKYLMKDILRDEMHFKGVAMTDWNTIKNLMGTGIAKDGKEATTMSMKAGIDMDMTSEHYVELLPALVREGIISEEQVNDAVRRVLHLKKQAGLLDNPLALLDKKREEKELLSEQNRKETKEITLKSMVLLKNKSAILPLNKEKKKIAIIGPFAKASKDMLGWWHCMGKAEEVETYFDGIKKEFKQANISYAQGCKIDRFKMAGQELIPEAVEVAKAADVVLLFLGEEFWMSGEGGGTASLHLPSVQETLIKELSKVGKPVVTIINAGRPYVLTEIEKFSDALVYAWMPGTTGASALADILSGAFNPQGKLPVTFPYHEGQIPIFYNYRRTSHAFTPGIAKDRYTTTYRDVQNESLYPFGYGLSYTQYTYSDIVLNTKRIKEGEMIEASVQLTNTGNRKGTEVVQLYIGDKICSVTRPVKELKDHQLVELAPGETRTVTFTITPDKLSFIGPGKAYKRMIEKGEFTVFIGTNSADCKAAEFILE